MPVTSSTILLPMWGSALRSERLLLASAVPGTLIPCSRLARSDLRLGQTGRFSARQPGCEDRSDCIPLAVAGAADTTTTTIGNVTITTDAGATTTSGEGPPVTEGEEPRDPTTTEGVGAGGVTTTPGGEGEGELDPTQETSTTGDEVAGASDETLPRTGTGQMSLRPCRAVVGGRNHAVVAGSETVSTGLTGLLGRQELPIEIEVRSPEAHE